MKGKEITVDVLGRICLPKKMRESLNIKCSSSCFIEQDEDKLIITKSGDTQVCPVCGKRFSKEYVFCPYDGQYLMEKEKKENE